MKTAKYLTLIVCLALLAVLPAGCSKSQSIGTTAQVVESPTKLVLKAVSVGAAPSVDGKEDDSVWKKAPVLKVVLEAQEGVEPKEIQLKAVYTKDMIYLLSMHKDSTPLKEGDVWEFDGTRWSKGPYDDSLAYLWNINNSIIGFNEKGFDVMTHKLGLNDDIFDFRIEGKVSREKAWEGAEQKGDYWGWCGLPEFYGKGDDFCFVIDPDYVRNPSLGQPVVLLQHDSFENKKPWIKNSTVINGEERPKYKLKEGLTVETTPRPYIDQVVEITDYLSFKKGDRLPYIVGLRNVTWGGSKDDIDVKGNWFNGSWTIEMVRKLNTSYKDDIQFSLEGSTSSFYSFVVIVRDGGKGYAISPPVSLELRK